MMDGWNFGIVAMGGVGIATCTDTRMNMLQLSYYRASHTWRPSTVMYAVSKSEIKTNFAICQEFIRK